MNKNLLVGAMKEHGDRQEDLARAIGLSRTQLSKKINGTKGASFTQPEIKAIRERYDLDDAKVVAIFFAQDVSKKDTNN